MSDLQMLTNLDERLYQKVDFPLCVLLKLRKEIQKLGGRLVGRKVSWSGKIDAIQYSILLISHEKGFSGSSNYKKMF